MVLGIGALLNYNLIRQRIIVLGYLRLDERNLLPRNSVPYV